MELHFSAFFLNIIKTMFQGRRGDCKSVGYAWAFFISFSCRKSAVASVVKIIIAKAITAILIL